MDKDVIIIKKGDLIVNINFGHGEDIAVKTVMSRNEKGEIRILSCDRIGRTSNFDTEEKRQEYINNIKI